MILRDYQELTLLKTYDYIDSYDGPAIIVSPMGSGKSLYPANIANKYGKTLVVQPAIELLHQNFKKYQFYADNGTIYSAGAKSKEVGDVTFATIGSIYKTPELFKDFEILVVDECHLYPTEESMFGDFLMALPHLKVIGLTATPFRVTRSLMGSKATMLTSRKFMWKDIIHVVQIEEIKHYWPELTYTLDMGDKNVLKVNTTGSEYTEKSLERYVTTVHKRIMDYAGASDVPTMLFVQSIDQAERYAHDLRALAVHSKTKDRDAKIKSFLSGEEPLLVTVNIGGVGFDYPDLTRIIDANPTMSPGRYIQRVGRLVRRGPDQAEYIDLAGTSARFGKVEDIRYEKQKRSWYCYAGEMQLTGVPLDSLEVNPTSLPDTINFGKYNGTKLYGIPNNYLEWLLREDVVKGSLKKAVIEELKNRVQ